MYAEAAELETIYGLLVIRNGYLIAEDYWNGSGFLDQCTLASVTKSYTGALTGIALDQGYIQSIDQPILDYFPEYVNRITDRRKFDITIRHLLQMRAGYPWEESSEELFYILWHDGFRPTDLIRFPLIRDPGTDHDYSNLSSHILGIILARATGQDLLDYGNAQLFSRIDAEPGGWEMGRGGYRLGSANVSFTARNAAKFGQLYLDGGIHDGEQVVPAEWIADSLQTYSENAWDYRIGRNVKETGYGYQWWPLRSGRHRYNMAWGHGGQLIMLFRDLDMVIVVTADPFINRSDGETWRHERNNINLVADFIARLPAE
jgi:CubicO group peptidase (beta-lactamase class C family)